MMTTTETWHGTTNGYNYHACRCDNCRTAATRAIRKWRAGGAGRARTKELSSITSRSLWELARRHHDEFEQIKREISGPS